MNPETDHPEQIRTPRTTLRLSRGVNADINTLLASTRKQASKGLHIGTGSKRIPGLINCDFYNPEAELKADAGAEGRRQHISGTGAADAQGGAGKGIDPCG